MERCPPAQDCTFAGPKANADDYWLIKAIISGVLPLSDDRHLLATSVDFPAIVFARLDVDCTHVNLKIFYALNARNRYDIFALGEEPGEGELGGSIILFCFR